MRRGEESVATAPPTHHEPRVHVEDELAPTA